MARNAKTAEPEPDLNGAGAPPKKSKKKLILIIVTAVVLLAGGGTAAFLMLTPPPAPKRGGATAAAEASTPAADPKFIEFGQFTANLMYENEDRYIQVDIAFKITQPELEEKIKATKPEIQHRINMLLQSKYPSELYTIEGKEKLAQEIKAQVEYVLGIRKTMPAIGADMAATPAGKKSGLSDVLFTSFIIQ